MIDRVLIDTLNLKAEDFAVGWKNKIRKAPHLKHCNELDDPALMETNRSLYPLLARTLDRGLDRSLVGGFFVTLGKEQVQRGIPVSETVYSVNLAQQTVIEYVMTDFALDSPIRMYQAMEVITKVAEFFLLGCFYLTKGFLEATYTQMHKKDHVSEELLKKYFADDFFFKQN